MKTKPDRISQLLKARTQVQRRLRPILNEYEIACQSLEDEIARIEGREPRRVEAIVRVASGLDSNSTQAR